MGIDRLTMFLTDSNDIKFFFDYMNFKLIFMVCYGLDMDGMIYRISSSVLSALLCSMAFRLMDGN